MNWRLVTIFLIGGLAVGAYTGERRVAQPYPFDHAAHTGKADCELCHQGVRSGARAGLPDLTFCTGCHASAPGAKPSAEQTALWEQALAGEAPPWSRLYRLPSHVAFSHRRHVLLAGIDCDRCHGDIGSTSTPPQWPLVKLKMRDCIGCHESEEVTVDCTGCHR